MLLHIVARGKIGRSPEAELVERYMKRIQWPTKLTELPERDTESWEALQKRYKALRFTQPWLPDEDDGCRYDRQWGVEFS